MNRFNKDTFILPTELCECGRRSDINTMIKHEDNYYCPNCFRQILTPKQKLVQFRNKLQELLERGNKNENRRFY